MDDIRDLHIELLQTIVRLQIERYDAILASGAISVWSLPDDTELDKVMEEYRFHFGDRFDVENE